jgi:ABC-2 type transport system ATP-binding protein
MISIETVNLTKRFGELTAVDSANLAIEAGEVFGLLGPNGAGKTTTINMLVTLLAPTSGTAKVNGFDVRTQAAKVRQSVGVVFQDPSVDTVLTARENMELHARLYSVPKGLREKRIAELLNLMDLQDRADEVVKVYSGGMRRRLELARGLLHRPTVLFLDEPTLGLDPQTRELTWQYIGTVAREEQTTVVLTTHYMDEADAVCDRIGIIDHGRIIALDTPRNLKRSVGGDLIRLEMAKPDPEVFQGLDYVKKAEVTDSELALTVEHAAAHLPEILSRAQGVASVEVHTPTLNDVFLKFTGRRIRDEEGGEGWAEAASRWAAQRG